MRAPSPRSVLTCECRAEITQSQAVVDGGAGHPGHRARAASGDVPELAWHNELGGLCFRLGERYLKWNPRSTGIDLRRERARLKWLERRHPAPVVLDYGDNGDAQWMLTVALPARSVVQRDRRCHQKSLFPRSRTASSPSTRCRSRTSPTNYAWRRGRTGNHLSSAQGPPSTARSSCTAMPVPEHAHRGRQHVGRARRPR